ncbi:hypothetical protein JOM56_014120 [Amanita muscaria]
MSLFGDINDINDTVTREGGEPPRKIVTDYAALEAALRLEKTVTRAAVGALEDNAATPSIFETQYKTVKEQLEKVEGDIGNADDNDDKGDAEDDKEDEKELENEDEDVNPTTTKRWRKEKAEERKEKNGMMAIDVDNEGVNTANSEEGRTKALKMTMEKEAQSKKKKKKGNLERSKFQLDVAALSDEQAALAIGKQPDVAFTPSQEVLRRSLELHPPDRNCDGHHGSATWINEQTRPESPLHAGIKIETDWSGRDDANLDGRRMYPVVISKLAESTKPLPKAQRRGSIVILGMFALAKRIVLTDHADVMLKVGLGNWGKVTSGFTQGYQVSNCGVTRVVWRLLDTRGSAKKIKGKSDGMVILTAALTRRFAWTTLYFGSFRKPLSNLAGQRTNLVLPNKLLYLTQSTRSKCQKSPASATQPQILNQETEPEAMEMNQTVAGRKQYSGLIQAVSPRRQGCWRCVRAESTSVRGWSHQADRIPRAGRVRAQTPEIREPGKQDKDAEELGQVAGTLSDGSSN